MFTRVLLRCPFGRSIQPTLRICQYLGPYQCTLSNGALRLFAKRSKDKKDKSHKTQEPSAPAKSFEHLFKDDDIEADATLKEEESADVDIIVDMDVYIKKYYKYIENELARYSTTIAGINVGVASPDMFDNLNVNAYGGKIPFKNLANIQVRSSTQLFISTHDPSVLDSIKKSLEEFDPEFIVNTEGHNGLTLSIPRVTHESRVEVANVISERAEKSKKRIRKFRQIAYDKIHKMLSEKDRIFNMSNDLNEFQSKILKQVDVVKNARKNEILQESE